LREKASKRAGFLGPTSSKNHSNEGKGKDKKKGGEEKKAVVALLVFIMATFGGNVFKRSA